jgi:hypothetical protein
MYKAQGMDLTDEQIDMMSKMMTPEMIKQSSDALLKNPGLADMAKQ